MLKIPIFLLRIALGFLFFYAGFSKIVDPQWSAKGYLENAQTLSGFYQWLSSLDILPLVNFLNEWGTTLIGVSLILGAFVRISTITGILLMLLYYIPILHFPYVGDHSFLIDEHILYILVLVLLFYAKAGTIWGLDALFSRLKFP